MSPLQIDTMAFERGMKKHGLKNNVVIGGNGVEALEILLGTHPEKTIDHPYLIFLDLNMPMMGGLEFLERVRNDDTIGLSTVFVLTTSEYRSDVLAAYKQHVAGYIVKKSLADSEFKVHDLIQRYEELVLLPGAPGNSSL